MQIPVELEKEEWDRLLTILANIKESWVVINPFIVKINKQIQEPHPPIAMHKGNSDENVSNRSKTR